jgi:hypothetical protein
MLVGFFYVVTLKKLSKQILLIDNHGHKLLEQRFPVKNTWFRQRVFHINNHVFFTG